MGEHEDQLGTLQYGFGLKVQIPTVKLSNAFKNIKAEINSPLDFAFTTGVQRLTFFSVQNRKQPKNI